MESIKNQELRKQFNMVREAIFRTIGSKRPGYMLLGLSVGRRWRVDIQDIQEEWVSCDAVSLEDAKKRIREEATRRGYRVVG